MDDSAAQSQVSRSRARRLRNAALKRDMWGKCQKQPSASSSNDFDLATAFGTLSHQLDMMHMSVHYVTSLLTGWSPDWSCKQPHASLGQSTTHPWPIMEQYFSQGDHVRFPTWTGTSMTNDSPLQPCPDKVDYRNWMPAEKGSLFQTGSHMEEELHNEAAIVIQRSYRGHALRHESSDSQGSLQDPWVTCWECSIKFHEHAEDADSCDKCARPLHADCGVNLPHPVEPYHVCSACASRVELLTQQQYRKPDDDSYVLSVSMAGESPQQGLSTEERDQQNALVSESSRRGLSTEERVQQNSWDSGFSGSAESKQDVGNSPSASNEIEKTACVLESRLDYMVKFLECDKHRTLPEALRTSVLEKVKGTFCWRSEGRSEAEVKCKIEELDLFMTDAVKQVYPNV